MFEYINNLEKYTNYIGLWSAFFFMIIGIMVSYFLRKINIDIIKRKYSNETIIHVFKSNFFVCIYAFFILGYIIGHDIFPMIYFNIIDTMEVLTRAYVIGIALITIIGYLVFIIIASAIWYMTNKRIGKNILFLKITEDILFKDVKNIECIFNGLNIAYGKNKSFQIYTLQGKRYYKILNELLRKDKNE